MDVFTAHYNTGYDTVAGDTPTRAEGLSLEDGLVAIPPAEPVKGVKVDAGDRLEYDFPDGFNIEEGTFEFWFRPDWNSSDNPTVTYIFVRTGSST